MALRVGLEPTTYRLTAGCSAIELPKKTLYWRLPTLPGRYHPSTIGVKRLNFCVRYGYRCLPLAIVTRLKTTLELLVYFKHELLGQVLDILVSISFKYYYSFTLDLSTRWSSWCLTLSKRNLILRGASCLDAFSTYPVQT